MCDQHSQQCIVHTHEEKVNSSPHYPSQALTLDSLSLSLFHGQDYMDPNIPNKGFLTNVRFMFDLRDVMVDVTGEWAGQEECISEGSRRSTLVKAAGGVH
jgi:hypothetical protein